MDYHKHSAPTLLGFCVTSLQTLVSKDMTVFDVSFIQTPRHLITPRRLPTGSFFHPLHPLCLSLFLHLCLSYFSLSVYLSFFFSLSHFFSLLVFGHVYVFISCSFSIVWLTQMIVSLNAVPFFSLLMLQLRLSTQLHYMRHVLWLSSTICPFKGLLRWSKRKT